MSKTCEVCGKHPMTGNTVSHAHNTTKRLFIPNLRTIKSKSWRYIQKNENLHEMFEGNVEIGSGFT